MLVIDRFEGDFAVVETSNGMINIPISDIPSDAKEGDVLIVHRDVNVSNKRKKNIDKMMNGLFID